ncbi:glycosyltransferase family 2 protein [Nannocystis sp.]|uniref:glycosyltransferase family 2 protein n=1 Tax=Nannocystis sp. TaxID=1962667 RepID=UPI0024297B23|nr:glycosyltransferase family 2 protein [Nannocystis sp.]MBK7826318.1 glycosyltransferase family 2 protein [Nannocystis sp.]MBK9758168.1 glycosyltransferase family 2 protein [Nannocystis sp.]
MCPSSLEPPDLSVVIPVFNEVDSIDELHGQIVAAISAMPRSYEILFVNDGSRDGSREKLNELAARDANVSVVHFRKNFGKSPALAAGFARVRGQIVMTLDADLQDDPALIPDFVARIEAGADLVSGWKRLRHDPLDKTLPSKVFNGIVRKVSGVALHDFNCGFKAYRSACVRELSIYGGFHRFLPAFAGARGFRIEELVVNHRARKHGVSKFGAGRYFDGFLDLLTVLMITRFRTRPLHFFGLPGAGLAAVGMALLTYLAVLWTMSEPIGTRPLLTLGVLLTLAGVQLLGLGLVAELLVRTTIRNEEIFSISDEITWRDPRALSASAPQGELPAAAGQPPAVARSAESA